MKYTSLSILVFFSMTFFSSCQFDNDNTEEEEKTSIKKDEEEDYEIEINDKDDLFEALHTLIDKVEEEVGAAEENLDKKNRVEAVDYETLKHELPRMVGGMLRQNAKGERSGIGKFKVSTAQAEYETDDRYMKLTITDTGNVPFAKAGYKLLSKADFVHESDDEYLRATEIDGFPAYEGYTEDKKTGAIVVIINDRFIVNVEGENVSERNLQRAIEKVNLKRLASL